MDEQQLAEMVDDVFRASLGDRSPAVVFASALAERMLQATIAEKFDDLKEMWNQLVTEFESFGAGVAILYWCDAVTKTMPPPDADVKFVWMEQNSGRISENPDDLEDLSLWATKLITARWQMDQEEYVRLVDEANESGRVSDYVFRLLTTAGMTLKSGGDIRRWL